MDTQAPVIAVDYPTGLDSNTGIVEDRAFRASETVTFSTLKTGHVLGQGPDCCGRVTVADIGINGGHPCMYVAEESDAIRPVRGRTTHKWSAGAVLVVGGSSGMVGASVFAGRSALSFGAGSVVVASPMADMVHQIAPQLPTLSLEEAESRLDRFDVVIGGPGLGESDADAVVPILQKSQKVVLDAGGLIPHLLDAATKGDGEVVITPHTAEFKRVAGIGGGAYSTRAFARKKGITILLKGNPTLLTNGGSPILVRSGGPELASIGTGDVLSGMIGALWARGLDGTAAAVSGAYWHGVSAHDLAVERTVTADVLSDYVSAYAW
jgi:NAD(P)H-hydrate epimerase